MLPVEYYETHPRPGRPPKDVQDVLYDLRRYGRIDKSGLTRRAANAVLTYVDRLITDDVDRATELCNQALEIRDLDPDLAAYTLAIDGTIAMRGDRYSEAQERFSASLDLARTPLQIADTLRRNSTLARLQNDVDRALSLSRLALSHSRPVVISDRGYGAAAHTYANALFVDYWSGRRPVSEARFWHEKAFRHADRQRSPRNWLMSLGMLARDLACSVTDGITPLTQANFDLLARIQAAFDSIPVARPGRPGKTSPTGLRIRWAILMTRLDLGLVGWQSIRDQLLTVRKGLLDARCYHDAVALSLDLVEHDHGKSWQHLTDILDQIPDETANAIGRLLLQAGGRSVDGLRQALELVPES